MSKRLMNKLSTSILLLMLITITQAQTPALNNDCTDASQVHGNIEKDCNALSKAYAIQATTMLRNEVIDPTSFTLLEVVAFMRSNKNPHKPLIFAGCIHFVASNRLGARMQSCGGYYVDKKGNLQVGAGDPASTGDPCTCVNHDERRVREIDVTAEAKSSIQ
jgi:hypothetical protein